MRDDLLHKLHPSHIGIQGCLRRAREVLYWPGMNQAVEDNIAQCDSCNKYQSEQAKEPMICHEVPSRPWEKVAIDLFQLEHKDYIVTVDYYSNFFEVDQLSTKSAKSRPTSQDMEYQIKSSQTMANHLHQESLKNLLAHTPLNM